jgi:hypothetical protein
MMQLKSKVKHAHTISVISAHILPPCALQYFWRYKDQGQFRAVNLLNLKNNFALFQDLFLFTCILGSYYDMTVTKNAFDIVPFL